LSPFTSFRVTIGEIFQRSLFIKIGKNLIVEVRSDILVESIRCLANVIDQL
jgi:hypothetical protein